MVFKVNDNCIGCGLCEGTCPNVFRMGDTGVAEVYNNDLSDDDYNAALEALNNCPCSAIEEE